MKKDVVKKRPSSETANNARWLRAIKLFVESGAIGAKAAMLEAGFSQTTAAKQCQLLKKHPTYIEWVKAKTEKNLITKKRLNEKLLRWANSNITDYFDFGDFTVAKGKETQYRFITVKNLAELSREITDCISEIQETANGIRIKLVDKLAAVAKLAEINGLIAPRQTEVTGKDGKPIAMKFTFGEANLKPQIPDAKNRMGEYN